MAEHMGSEDAAMPVAVMGAGAVGSYFGGMLARAGHAVTLIGRAAHVAVWQREGLELDTQRFDERSQAVASHPPPPAGVRKLGNGPSFSHDRIAVAASTEAAAVRGAKLVLVCVKSTDTEHAAAAMAPYLDADALVLSLQNGVDNAERLRQRLAQRVVAAAVYVAVEMAGPGRVRHHGRGDLVLERWQGGAAADAAAVAALFERAAVPVQLVDSVAAALWSKLALNCAYNAVSAIAQLPYGRVVVGEGIERVMHDALDECVAVAHAAGVALPREATWEAALRLAASMPAQMSSTAQDLARARPSEIDHLNGHVVRLGERLGVATPVNRVLWALVKLLQGRD